MASVALVSGLSLATPCAHSINSSAKQLKGPFLRFPYFTRRPLCLEVKQNGYPRVASAQSRNKHDRVLRATGEDDTAAVPASSEKIATEQEQNNKGPPLLTIIAGVVVLVGCIWAVASLLQGLIGLFVR